MMRSFPVISPGDLFVTIALLLHFAREACPRLPRAACSIEIRKLKTEPHHHLVVQNYTVIFRIGKKH